MAIKGICHGGKTKLNDLPFEELKKHSLINDLAQALDKDPDFSRNIRKEILPGNSSAAP